MTDAELWPASWLDASCVGRSVDVVTAGGVVSGKVASVVHMKSWDGKDVLTGLTLEGHPTAVLPKPGTKVVVS